MGWKEVKIKTVAIFFTNSFTSSNSAFLQVQNLKFTFGNSTYPNIEARCAAFSLMFFLWNSLFAMVWALFCSDSQGRTAKKREREISVKTTSINRTEVCRKTSYCLNTTYSQQRTSQQNHSTQIMTEFRDRKEKKLLVTCFIFSSRCWRRSSTPESTNAAEQADARFSEVSDTLGWGSVLGTVFALLAIWSEPFKDCWGSLTSCSLLATTWNWEILEVNKTLLCALPCSKCSF